MMNLNPATARRSRHRDLFDELARDSCRAFSELLQDRSEQGFVEAFYNGFGRPNAPVMFSGDPIAAARKCSDVYSKWIDALNASSSDGVRVTAAQVSFVKAAMDLAVMLCAGSTVRAVLGFCEAIAPLELGRSAMLYLEAATCEEVLGCSEVEAFQLAHRWEESEPGMYPMTSLFSADSQTHALPGLIAAMSHLLQHDPQLVSMVLNAISPSAVAIAAAGVDRTLVDSLALGATADDVQRMLGTTLTGHAIQAINEARQVEEQQQLTDDQADDQTDDQAQDKGKAEARARLLEIAEQYQALMLEAEAKRAQHEAQATEQQSTADRSDDAATDEDALGEVLNVSALSLEGLGLGCEALGTMMCSNPATAAAGKVMLAKGVAFLKAAAVARLAAAAHRATAGSLKNRASEARGHAQAARDNAKAFSTTAEQHGAQRDQHRVMAAQNS